METLRALHLSRCLLWHRVRGERWLEEVMLERLDRILGEPAARAR